MNKIEPETIPGLGWAFGRWRKVFAQLDKEAIARRVREMKLEHDTEHEPRLCFRVVRQAAKRSALLGVASASPALFPGIGTAISVVGIVPEEIYLVRQECTMVLTIAAIYDFDPADSERLYEIVALVGTPSRSIEALMTAKADLRLVAAKTVAALSPGAGRMSILGFKTISRRTVRRIPALGFFLGAGINFMEVRALGRKACRFYEQLRAKQAREDS
jgi:hypothetical protein